MANQEMLNSLDAAIGRSERVVQHNGKRIEYRDLNDLIAARNFLANQLAGAQQTDVLNRMTVAQFTRD